MNLKLLLSSFFTLMLCVTFAQGKKDSSNVKLAPKYEFWANKGFDLSIGAGVYFGNKYNAAYYNGKERNENDIYFLLRNKWRYDTLYNYVRENIGYNIGDSIWVNEEDLPEKMQYKVAYFISLGVGYRFTKNWALAIHFTNTALTAQDVFLLRFKTQHGNEKNHADYLECGLQGKEVRNMFDVSVSYTFHPHRHFKPFLELGFQLYSLKVKSFNAIIRGKSFNGVRFERSFELLNYNQNFVPGGQQQDSYIQYGGTGFGVLGTAGLKIAFNKFFSVDPAFSLSYARMPLEGYKNFKLNYAVYLRLVVNDLIFSAKKQ